MNIIRDFPLRRSLRDNPGLWGVLIFAGLLRFLFLTIKSPHFDEGVYGFFVQEIWRRGFFAYDPSNFHGPSYYYAIQFAEQIFGRGIFAFRFISGVFSLLSIYYVWRLNKFFGEVAIWAALALTVSPAAIFYSRYAMHESLFILLQILFVHHYFNFKNKPNSSSASGMGIYAALLFATKETTVIFLFCFLVSALLSEILEALKTQRSYRAITQSVYKMIVGENKENLKWIVLSLVVGFAVLFFFFSGEGAEPLRFGDFFRAYSFWTKTGTQHASGHEKPFNYWFILLARYEWPAFIGVLVAPVLIFIGSKPARFFGLFALANLAAYTVIPYKTPWCILGILWPLYFLTGFAMVEMRSFKFVQSTALRIEAMTPSVHNRSKFISGFLTLVLCLISLGMAIRLNFFHFQDSTEPYVYVQSSHDINAITDILNGRIQKFPEDLNMTILVGMKTTWPFPWTLANFTHVLYREILPDSGAADPIQALKDQRLLFESADVIMVDQVDEPRVEQAIRQKFQKSRFKLRDSYNPCTIFLNADKFKLSELAFVQNLSVGGETSAMVFSSIDPMGVKP